MSLEKTGGVLFCCSDIGKLFLGRGSGAAFLGGGTKLGRHDLVSCASQGPDVNSCAALKESCVLLEAASQLYLKHVVVQWIVSESDELAALSLLDCIARHAGR